MARFIIFGHYTKNFTSQKIDATCRACQKDTLSATFMQQLFHVFWIPIFPISRKHLIISCSSCGSNFPAAIYQEIDIDKNILKTPIRYHLSFSILPAFILLLIYIHYATEIKISSFKENPAINKCFVMHEKAEELKKTPYTFARIEDIKTDKIFFRPGQYAHSNSYDALKFCINKEKIDDDRFEENIVEFSKTDFQKLDISDVE